MLNRIVSACSYLMVLLSLAMFALGGMVDL